MFIVVFSLLGALCANSYFGHKVTKYFANMQINLRISFFFRTFAQKLRRNVLRSEDFDYFSGS